MFLLSPVIDLDYDYAAEASLELGRWDGQIKRYKARSAGTAHYTVFAASPTMIGELKGQVTEACLTELMDQLIRDTNFYMASSTPLPDSPIVLSHREGTEIPAFPYFSFRCPRFNRAGAVNRKSPLPQLPLADPAPSML